MRQWQHIGKTFDLINLVSHLHVICGIAEVLIETYKTCLALQYSVISVPDIYYACNNRPVM